MQHLSSSSKDTTSSGPPNGTTYEVVGDLGSRIARLSGYA